MIAVGPVAVLSSEKLLDTSAYSFGSIYLTTLPHTIGTGQHEAQLPKKMFNCSVGFLLLALLGMNISGPPRLPTKGPKKQLEHGGPHLRHLLRKVFLVRASVLQLFFGNLCWKSGGPLF